MPHSYQQEHADARQFSNATLPVTKCLAPWWLPAQVGAGLGHSQMRAVPAYDMAKR